MRLKEFCVLTGIALAFGSPTHAAIMPVLIKEVNPGPQTGAYAGFARNTGNQSTPFTSDLLYNTTPALSSTWVSYSLGLQATAGEKISAIAASINGVPSPTAGFNQRWNYNVDTEIFMPTPESTNVTNADSHIIRLGSVVGAAATENINQSGGPPTAPDNATQDYGVGSSLTAQFGFNAAEQNALAGQVIKYAYLVVPRGFEPTISYVVNVGFNHPDGTPDPFGVTFSSCCGFEPGVNLIDIGERELSAGTILQAFSAQSDSGPITHWSDLTQTKGLPVAIQPSLSADGTFTWNPAGSKAGKKGSGSVVYQWSAIAYNQRGPSALNPAFRVTLIPEPATMSLIGLATLSLIGVTGSRTPSTSRGRPNV